MRDFLIVVGLTCLAIALRSCRSVPLRKSGAFMLLIASFFAGYFLTQSLVGGAIGIALWFFLPWITLLTQVRKQRLPIHNRLIDAKPPKDDFFPNATETIHAMQEAGFEHVEDSCWSWAGMQQYFRIYWNAEQEVIGSVCLCEQDQVAFAFTTLTSRTQSGKSYRTTNFPFSPTLKCNGKIQWNHVPCEQKYFENILKAHGHFLRKRKVQHEDLTVPNPETLVSEFEKEMREQIDFNLHKGLIIKTDKEHFKYSTLGLFFLWKQLVKDMIRLC